MKRDTWDTVSTFCIFENYPKLPCPYCNSQSSLSFDDKSLMFRAHENALKHKKELSKHLPDETDVKGIYDDNKFLGILYEIVKIASDSLWDVAKFCGFLVCSNCNKNVSATGTALIPSKLSNPAVQKNFKQIRVEYFSPPIPMFDFSPEIPNSVQDNLLQAFNHFHSDLSASGSKLRRVVEQLCDELNYKGKNLHRKIEQLGTEFPQEAELLESLKFMGNEAAHADLKDKNHLLDGFQIIELVLKVFERKKQMLEMTLLSNNLKNNYDPKLLKTSN